MRILYGVHQFFPEYSAGTEILTYKTAREMAGRGHDVLVFSGHPRKKVARGSGPVERYQFNGIPVERYRISADATGAFSNPMETEYRDPFCAEFFRRRLKEFRPHVVHLYHLQRLSATPIDVCRELGIPILFTATDYWLLCPTNQLLTPDGSLCLGPDADALNCLRHMVKISQGRRIDALFRRLPDRILAYGIRMARSRFACDIRHLARVRALVLRAPYLKERITQIRMVLVATRFMAEVLTRFGVEQSRIRVVPFGIDSANFPPALEKGGRRVLRVGFIGTLWEHKGAHLLLQAVRSLPNGLPLSVKVYGSPDQFPEYVRGLRTIIAGDQRVQFCGVFPNGQMGEVLQQLDVLVVPSLWYENSPLVLHEAQAAKVPLVAANVGGLKDDIVDGENGFLFERGDVARLSQIIHMLCCERSAVRKLSERARNPRSLASYVDELEGIYADVLSHSR